MTSVNITAKAIGKNGANFTLEYKGATLHRARQDTAIFGQTEKTILVGIFDGHGAYGASISSNCAKFFWDYVLVNQDLFIDLVKNNNINQVKTLISESFQSINQKTKLKSGTTVSLVIILNVESRRILINANVGDSPIFQIDQQVTDMYQDQSVDNLETYQLYVDYQVANGKPILEPDFSICRNIPLNKPSNYNQEWPPKLYQINDNKVSVRENSKEIVRQILDFNFGTKYSKEYIDFLSLGTQTIRTNKNSHPMQNFGSHLGKYGTQMFSSIGDHETSICLPFIQINELNPNIKSIVLFSDGIFDFIEDKNELKPLILSSTSATQLWNELIEYIDIKATDPNSKHYKDKSFKAKEYFKHDDCSLVLIHF